ncbi:DUF6328 family protein [Salinispora oceanensis]|uniref:DUF6328 family protein n=1 Tax=Salinispora oceanensis TaxID=1050199 RepID=UPI000377ABAB|nr:DUF6328 family protein [Salinispora oceanensis]
MAEETETRWRRRYAELLQELRIAQMGVQILFAFLLALPFSSAFGETNAFQRTLYIISFLSTAAAAVATIAPVAFHRALFRQGRGPELARFTHSMTNTGLLLLILAVIVAVLLITDFVLELPIALALTGLILLWLLLLWVLVPIGRSRTGSDSGTTG